ncbi:MAG: creatininase family protein [Cyanobacteria bacterium P01_H01_bin.130]
MELHLMTWPAVETYLQTSTGIILPIGSTEQHGPTGAIGTDAICAEAIAKGVGDGEGAIVGPTINVGMALHHMAFPGSMSLQPSTLIAVVRDYVFSLAQHGFQRFFFVNGHGGNMATLKAAFQEIYGELSHHPAVPQGDRIRCHLANWYMSPAAYKLAKDKFGNAEGSHATPSEVALVQYVYPETVMRKEMDPEIGPRGHRIYSAADFRAHYPDGRMGSNPNLATPELGKLFYEAAVTDLRDSYRKFMESPATP